MDFQNLVYGADRIAFKGQGEFMSTLKPFYGRGAFTGNGNVSAIQESQFDFSLYLLIRDQWGDVRMLEMEQYRRM